MRTISRFELETLLDQERPNNTDRARGYALVNVLSPSDYQRGHIPGSMNIPKGSEAEFERRFDKAKEIVIDRASPDCESSEISADTLEQRGFSRVVRYPGGMSEWLAGERMLEEGEDRLGTDHAL